VEVLIMTDSTTRADILTFLADALAARDGSDARRPESLEGLHLVGDLRMDSLDTVSLFFDIEERFSVRIPEGDIAPLQLLHVGNLVNYIQEHGSE
jgi:acyl carrier protein